MDVLYKRFFIVALMIASMGVLTANLIQQTKREPSVQTILAPKTLLGNACTDDKTCRLLDAGKRFSMIG